MNSRVDLVKFEGEKLIIKGSILNSSIKKSDTKIIIQSENSTEFYTEYDINLNKGNFLFKKNVDTIFRKYNMLKDMKLSIFIEHDNKRIKLEDSNADISNNEYTLSEKLCKVSILKSQNNEIILSLTSEEIKAKVNLEDLDFINGDIKLKFNIESNSEKKLKLYNKFIILKDRDFDAEYTIEVENIIDNNYKAIINDEVLSKIKLEKLNNVIDVFVRLSTDKFKLDVPVQVATNYNHSLNFKYNILSNNKFFRYKPYKNGFNAISIYIKSSEVNATVEELILQDEKIKIEGYISSNEMDIWSISDNKAYLVLKKRKKINGNYNYKWFDGIECYSDEVLVDMKILNTYFELSDNLIDKLINEIKTKDEIWDIFIRVTNNQNNIHDIILKYNASYNSYIDINNNNVRLFSNRFNNGLSYSINPKI